MKTLLLTILLGTLGASATAQFTYDQYFSFRGFIPDIIMDDRSSALQVGLYPSMYKERSVSQDLRWLVENDSALMAFWQQQGDTVLHVLRELSGLEWQEESFRIHLVRFFPSEGSPEPMIIPLGGIKDGPLTEAAPSGHNMILNLMYQLSRRLLAQADRPDLGRVLPIAYHPLMKPGPYRRDNLAMLLAVSASRSIIGVDSTAEAYESAFWRSRTPGRYILEKYLLSKWILTPQQPLADWIMEEPYGSELVQATSSPRGKTAGDQDNKLAFIEGLPSAGMLGFSVRTDDANFPCVDKIDVHRLAYACGLRQGDEIRRVDESLVRTHRALVEKILDAFELNGGATLEIRRDERIRALVLRPMNLPDSLDGEDRYETDSVSDSPSESVPPVDSATKTNPSLPPKKQ